MPIADPYIQYFFQNTMVVKMFCISFIALIVNFLFGPYIFCVRFVLLVPNNLVIYLPLFINILVLRIHNLR